MNLHHGSELIQQALIEITEGKLKAAFVISRRIQGTNIGRDIVDQLQHQNSKAAWHYTSGIAVAKHLGHNKAAREYMMGTPAEQAEIRNVTGMTDAALKAAAAKAIQNLVSTEVQKAVAGGLGGVGEREDLSKQLSSNLNNQQLLS